MLSNITVETEFVGCFYGVNGNFKKTLNFWGGSLERGILSNMTVETEFIGCFYGVNGDSKNPEFLGCPQSVVYCLT